MIYIIAPLINDNEVNVLYVLQADDERYGSQWFTTIWREGTSMLYISHIISYTVC
jgi:hypothetical protein